MSELRVDVGYFKMIADYYGRKCPCWAGKYVCPCPPFVETRNCHCGAVRAKDDPKADNPRFSDCIVDFELLARIIKGGYRCPKDATKTCFCKEFLETQECELHALEKTGKRAR